MKKIIILFFIGLLAFSYAKAEDIVLIVNKNVPVSSIDAAKAIAIYSLLETRWSDGSTINVINLNEGEANTKFYSFIQKDETQMKKIWLKKKLTEGAKVPTTVNSESQVLNKVASTPGAIGFISKSKVNDSVKVVATF